MEDSNNLRIELVIRKDNTTEKQFELSQCDYNFTTNYYDEEEERKPIEVNLSGGIKNGLDPLFLAWASNQPGDWSGSLKVFIVGNKTPAVSLKFDKIITSSCSQSFSEYNTGINETYFSSIIKGVVFNDVSLS